MLAKVLAFLEADHAEPPNSLDVAQAFGLSVQMSERLLEMLEDAGHIVTERAGSACSTGGCGSGGCGSGGGCGSSSTTSTGGGCSSAGPAATLNALAEAAKARKQGASS